MNPLQMTDGLLDRRASSSTDGRRGRDQRNRSNLPRESNILDTTSSGTWDRIPSPIQNFLGSPVLKLQDLIGRGEKHTNIGEGTDSKHIVQENGSRHATRKIGNELNRANILFEGNHVVEVSNILPKNNPKILDKSIDLLPVKLPINIAKRLPGVLNAVIVRGQELILVDIDKEGREFSNKSKTPFHQRPRDNKIFQSKGKIITIAEDIIFRNRKMMSNEKNDRIIRENKEKHRRLVALLDTPIKSNQVKKKITKTDSATSFPMKIEKATI